MPYEIETKDGIVIRNIPDNIKPDDPSIKERVMRARGSADKPTVAEKVAGSAPVRFAVGAAEPILGAAQLGANLWGMGDKTVTIPNPFNKDVPLYESSINQNLKTLENTIQRGRGPDAGFDAVRLAGNVFSPVNAVAAKAIPMVSSTAARTGVGAALGFGGSAITPVTSGDSYWGAKAGQVGTGTVAGAIATPILGKLADTLAPRVSAFVDRLSSAGQARRAQMAAAETDVLIKQALDDIGAKVDDVEPAVLQNIRGQVTEALKAGKKLDAAALFRKREFEEAGLEGTLGQITREPTQFAFERNMRSADPRLATRFNEQERAISGTFRGYGNEADEAQVAGGRISSFLTGLDKQAGKQVSEAYKVARESTGKDLELPLQGFAQDISKVERGFGKGNAAVQWAKSYFKDLGIFGGKQNKIFTIEDAEQALQQINQLKGNDPATNNAYSEITKAIKNAVTSADDQGGVFAGPRSLAAKRFEMRDMVPALKAAAEGDVSADRFVNQYLINGESKDVQSLAGLLKATNPELYGQARSQLGQHIFRAAYGENAAGDKALRPETLSKVLRQLGTEKLKAFFSEDEIAQMHRLSRVGAYMNSIPAASPVNTSNSLTAAVPLLARVPGAETLSNVLRAGAVVGRGYSDARAVNNAINARVPVGPAAISPEIEGILARVMGLGGLGAGILTAQEFR
jgi:hypothetical protein